MKKSTIVALVIAALIGGLQIASGATAGTHAVKAQGAFAHNIDRQIAIATGEIQP